MYLFRRLGNTNLSFKLLLYHGESLYDLHVGRNSTQIQIGVNYGMPIKIVFFFLRGGGGFVNVENVFPGDIFNVVSNII